MFELIIVALLIGGYQLVSRVRHLGLLDSSTMYATDAQHRPVSELLAEINARDLRHRRY